MIKYILKKDNTVLEGKISRSHPEEELDDLFEKIKQLPDWEVVSVIGTTRNLTSLFNNEY